MKREDNKIDEPLENEWIHITEDEIWKFVTKSITRILYDIIETYDDHEEQFVPVGWIRDYADDIAVSFPRVTPDMLYKKGKREI